MPSPRPFGKQSPHAQSLLHALWMPPQEHERRQWHLREPEHERRQWHLREPACVEQPRCSAGEAMENVPMPVIDGAAVGGSCALWCVPHAPHVQPEAKTTRGPIQRRGVACGWGFSHEVAAQSPSKGSDAASDDEIFESKRLGMALEKLMIERAQKDSPRTSEKGNLDVSFAGFQPKMAVSTSDCHHNQDASADEALSELFGFHSRRRTTTGADGPTVREPRVVELRRLQDIPTLPFGYKGYHPDAAFTERGSRGHVQRKNHRSHSARIPHTPPQDGCDPSSLQRSANAIPRAFDIQAVLRKMPMPKLGPMLDD